MALIDITKVEVGPRALVATVRLAAGAPLMTSEDLESTTRVYNLMPHIIEHVCLGDRGETFRDVMGHTELAHLLEHMTVELLAQTNVAGDMSSGRTRAVADDGRAYEIELACPDDVLVAGALSSAVWMLEWAFGGGMGAAPDVEAIVSGLVGLVESLPEPEPIVVPSATGVSTPLATGVSAPVATDVAATTTEPVGTQAASAVLRLADDDAGAAADNTTSENEVANAAADSEATARIVAQPAPVVVPAPDAAPDESPEARQSAADVPFVGDVSLPGMMATPSTTASLPQSRTVR